MKRISIDKGWQNYLNKLNLEHDGPVLREYLRILGAFRSYLGNKKPTTERAVEYLQPFAELSRNARARYTTIINGALQAFGEIKIDPVKTPRQEPRYLPQKDFDIFFETLGSGKRNKDTMVRDILMFRLMDAAGLRCNEAATLRVRDLFLEGQYEEEPYLIAHGKGKKDRSIPLAREKAQDLRLFIRDKKPEDLVFGLKVGSVVNKFYRWKKKAGVQLTAHDLRRHFASDLNSLGVDIRTTQNLMGHENVGTTQRYIGIPPEATRKAILLRQNYLNKGKTTDPDIHRKGGGEIYVETLHKQKIRELARIIPQEITLPSSMMTNLWRDLTLDFKPGKYYLPIGEVNIDKKQHISVSYVDPFAGSGEPQLIESLLSHLSTSGMSRYVELTDKDGIITKLRNEAEVCSQALMEFLKLITEEVKLNGVTLNFQDDAKPGLTKSFILTIWNDAINQADDHKWIDDSWYHNPEPITDSKLWQLKCGSFVIGIADNTNTLKNFEYWHKNLRTSFAEHSIAKDISAKNHNLQERFLEIRKRLIAFSETEKLPGHCEFC